MKIRTLINIFDHTLRLMYIFAGVLLIFCMLSISIEVASRYLLDRPIGWVIEIVEYSLLYIGFLTAPWVLKHGRHVKMDLVLNQLGPRTQSTLDMIASMIGAIVCFILCWFGGRVTWDLFQTHYTTPTVLELPKYIFVAIISVGSMALFLQFLIRVFSIQSQSKQDH
jgi:C4-dicarboxylate transporter DctQ subunit